MFDSPGLGWTYNQDYLIKYVNLYNDLMSFWKEELGDFIYESHYEKLVTEQVNETKNILKFPVLDSGCLPGYVPISNIYSFGFSPELKPSFFNQNSTSPNKKS